MQPTISISTVGLALVFLAGLVAGWLLGSVRLQGRLAIAVRQPGDASDSSRISIVKKTEKTLALKCQCGATWRFHETSGHPDQGTQPMPTGGVFTCPNCGRSIDLRGVGKDVLQLLGS